MLRQFIAVSTAKPCVICKITSNAIHQFARTNLAPDSAELLYFKAEIKSYSFVISFSQTQADERNYIVLYELDSIIETLAVESISQPVTRLS